MNSTTQQAAIPEDDHIFGEFEAYPFSSDADFKAGLPSVISAIRGQKRSAAQIDEMIARAQWFYFCRLKGLSIPFEAVVAAQQRKGRTDPTTMSSSSQAAASPSGQDADERVRRQTEALAQLNDLAEARRLVESGENANTHTAPLEANMAGGSHDLQAGMSFEMLAKLISEGRADEIANQNVIPDALNEAPPSESVMASRPKPWEQAVLQTQPQG